MGTQRSCFCNKSAKYLSDQNFVSFYIRMKILTLLFALFFCIQANSLTCWKCSEICSDKKHVKNFHDCTGCKWSSAEQETCAKESTTASKSTFQTELSQDLALTLPSSLKL